MDRIGRRLRREVQIKGHLAAHCRGIVTELQELSTEGGDGSFRRDRHFVSNVGKAPV